MSDNTKFSGSVYRPINGSHTGFSADLIDQPHYEVKRKLEYAHIPGQEAFDSGKNTSVIR